MSVFPIDPTGYRRSLGSTPRRENWQSGLAMKNYSLKDKPEPASNNETVWAFDLGKGSIGEAVRRGNEFLHKASLLIPAEFAETKTAAGRRRMWRTRQAHGSSGFAVARLNCNSRLCIRRLIR